MTSSTLTSKRKGEMLRVDHAGEYGAVAIYRGQLAVLDRRAGSEHIVAQIKEMAAQEQEHLDAFDAMLTHNRVRPTIFSPLWNAAGFALGAASAMLGEKSAHACTEAVETVIEQHYDDQVRECEDAGEVELAATFSKLRDDEAAHRDLAESEGAREAPGYSLLSGIIKAGCRVAIRIAEKA